MSTAKAASVSVSLSFSIGHKKMPKIDVRAIEHTFQNKLITLIVDQLRNRTMANRKSDAIADINCVRIEEAASHLCSSFLRYDY
jgi:hypothetical protein